MLRPLNYCALALSSILGSAAHADSTEYFRHLVFRESPYEEIRGNYPIDKATADKTSHFRFVRDEQGRLTEVSKRIGDAIVNDNGSWEGFLWFSPMLKIGYQNGEEIRQFFGSRDNRIAAHGEIYEQRFSYDNKGKRKSLQFFGQDGKPVDSEWGIQRYEWETLADGSVIENRYNSNKLAQTIRPDFHFGRVRIEFGNDDLIDFMFNIDESGNLIENDTGAAVDRLVYDANHNFTRWQVYNKNRQAHNGNAPGVAIGEHLLDNHGNKIGLRGFSTDGSDRAMFGGKIHFEYDTYGNVVRQAIQDLHGKVLHDTRFFMSQDGLRRTRVQNLDAHGKLTVGDNGFAQLDFLFDENNRPTGIKRFDANLNEIK